VNSVQLFIFEARLTVKFEHAVNCMQVLVELQPLVTVTQYSPGLTYLIS